MQSVAIVSYEPGAIWSAVLGLFNHDALAAKAGSRLTALLALTAPSDSRITETDLH
jgi:hypothetical protein